MFGTRKVRRLETQVCNLKMRVHNCETESAYLRRERDEFRATFTTPSGGYWLFTDAKTGVGAATLIKVFGTIPAAKKWIENVKHTAYNLLEIPTWAQIATLVDGRLVILEEMVAMPTRPWRRVWITVKD